MKYISILGSTGSVGTNALEVIKMFPKRFKVIGLAAGKNIQKLAVQIESFLPDIVAVYDLYYARRLKSLISGNSFQPKIVFGESGYVEVSVYNDVDVVLNAMVGIFSLIPTIEAIDSGKQIALANKEILVSAGNIIMPKVLTSGINLIPIDSEHSAIYQSMLGHGRENLKEIILTASGGPFLNLSENFFDNITPKDALNHPKWSMGNKISIDSSTLMNKALEVIEAQWLFGVSVDKIRVLIHPQSIVHSMVVYLDGSVIAQMSNPDMKIPIAYALSCPDRLDVNLNVLDFVEIGNLSFEDPDYEKFPCLSLGFLASKIGGTMPAVMSASNDVAVSAFLNYKISFPEIYIIIKETMNSHCLKSINTLEEIIKADVWARNKAIDLVNKYVSH